MFKAEEFENLIKYKGFITKYLYANSSTKSIYIVYSIFSNKYSLLG